ncbi:hypothetical protein DOY81_015275, partial [Sarcophaga bullata]
CTICAKAFKRPDALREHMASHSGTALYTCPWCPKSFNSNANMHAHRKKMHPKLFQLCILFVFKKIVIKPLLYIRIPEMESCLLCLEVNKNLVDSIKTNSAQWLEYQVAELIEKYFWPLNSLLTPLNSSLCLLCWEELNSFHKFYMRIEEAHINFGRPIKVGDKTLILEKARSTDNEDDKEFIQYGLLEPEILIDKPSGKEEIETLCNIKTEPQDESFVDVPIEDRSKLLDTDDGLSIKDPLEKLIKPKNTPSKNKRKVE